jgi:histidyl-tRNA synthetase
MKPSLPLVKGMREFYPAEMALRTYLYDQARKASAAFGYQEWDAPFIETIDLYAAKSGEELVEKQSFVFADRGGDKVTLRPEATPSLARMVAKKQGELTFPVRWWQWGPMWRYEQPQRGRTREFFQWNVDMLGVNSPEADAELLAVAATFLKSVGLGPGQAKIFVNNRRLMDLKFDSLGLSGAVRPLVPGFVDRRPKMAADAWDAWVLEQGLSADQLGGLKAILGNPELWKESDELVRLMRAVAALGIGEYVEFDPNIMRGLLYYTGTVFEAFDVSGSVRRAILGGGRYDNLLADVGGEPLSGVGFAMGDVVIGILLGEKGLLPAQLGESAPVLVTLFDEAGWGDSLRIATELRLAGIPVLAWPEPAKLAKQFKFADKKGVKIVVVCGPDEAAQGKATVKNLAQGTQETVDQGELVARVRGMVG